MTITTMFFAATRAAELVMNGRVVHRSFDLTDTGVAGLVAASAVHGGGARVAYGSVARGGSRGVRRR